ncbi:MAG TPA: tetratricopeptide repeat protein [Bryobacteraceae bacterium]|nr:tetratricopeptide repeat protein [Bryobacteraceae bacterium]
MVIVAATCAVYAPVRSFDFINFDDPQTVSENPHVRQGITPAGLRWALTSVEAANWFPVTRVSHLIDVQLFGMTSGPPHAVNVALHATAAVVLFLFLCEAAGAAAPAALVALLFALHPLHVESVAWISERKDVLAALFWFLALWAYVRYVKRPGLRRYLAVTAWFILGLLSKPMIVTLPFVFLLLDFWPLRRPLNRRLVREKVPFFALSVVASAVTFFVQSQSGAVASFGAMSFALRLENALVTYWVYLAKTFWPSGLAIFYPYPSQISLWLAIPAAVGLAAITAAVLWARRRAPYLTVGWFWYLVTLLPVIGIIQVGSQARADRYMYVPMVGAAIALAWVAADLLRRRPWMQAALAAAVALSAIPIAAAQVADWRNSETLFRHALEVTKANDVAEHNLGNYLMGVPGRMPEAIEHLEASLRINSSSAKTHADLGAALLRIPGKLPQALDEFQAAVRLTPDSPISHNLLADALAATGRLPEAVSEYRTAMRFAPGSAIPYNNLGNALAKMGRMPDAIAEYEAALRLDPDYAEAHNNLGVILADLPGRLPQALQHLEAALRLRPDSAQAHVNLGIALAKDPSRLNEAIAEFEASLRLQPNPELQSIVEGLRAGAR